jgi:hypothetical protein
MKTNNEKNTNTMKKEYKSIRLLVASDQLGFESYFGIELVIFTRAAARELAKKLNGMGLVAKCETMNGDETRLLVHAYRECPWARNVGCKTITPSYFTHLMGYAA